MKLRENVRQREQLKQELAELEKKPRGIFRAIVIIGIIIFNNFYHDENSR